MAIAYDTSVLGATNTKTWSHTCTGSNLILIVTVGNRNSNTASITYNGVSMTQIDTSVGSPYTDVTMWYLINPATGTNTVEITTTASDFRGASVSYTGVKQLSQPDSFNSGNSASTSVAVSTTVVASNCWIVAGGVNGQANGCTINAGRTVRQTGGYYSGGYLSMCLEDSNGTVSTGSVSTTFTGSASNQTTGFVISLAPYVVTSPTVTTQSATNITKNSFTGNGNITATGGANATRRGFCYKVGTTGDPTIADSIAYDDGDFGTGAFTKNIT